MTTDDIIKLARECGFPFNKYGLLRGDEDGEIDADEMLVAFFHAVQAVEREECAKVAEDSDHVVDDCGYYAQLGDANATQRNIVEAIRNRSKT